MVGVKSSFTPTKRGKQNKFQPCLRGGGAGMISFGVVLTWELEVLAILKGRGCKKFQIRNFPIV